MTNIGVDGPAYIGRAFFDRYYSESLRAFPKRTRFHLLDRPGVGQLAHDFVRANVAECTCVWYSTRPRVELCNDVVVYNADPDEVYARWQASFTELVVFWPVLQPLHRIVPPMLSELTQRYATQYVVDTVVADLDSYTVTLPQTVLEQIGVLLEEYAERQRAIVRPPPNEIEDIDVTPPDATRAETDDEATISAGDCIPEPTPQRPIISDDDNDDDDDGEYIPVSTSSGSDNAPPQPDSIAARASKRVRVAPDADFVNESDVIADADTPELWSDSNEPMAEAELEEFYSCVSRTHVHWPSTLFYRRHIAALRRLFGNMCRDIQGPMMRELFLIAAENRLQSRISRDCTTVACDLCCRKNLVTCAGWLMLPMFGDAERYPLTAAKPNPQMSLGTTCFARVHACVQPLRVLNAARCMYKRYEGSDEACVAADWVATYYRAFLDRMTDAQSACATNESDHTATTPRTE